MGASAFFLVANGYGIFAASPGLAVVRVKPGCSDGVFSAVYCTFAGLVVASDHASLKAGACVASIAVDPRETDSIFLTVISGAKTWLILALNGATLHASTFVAFFHDDFPDFHW